MAADLNVINIFWVEPIDDFAIIFDDAGKSYKVKFIGANLYLRKSRWMMKWFLQLKKLYYQVQRPILTWKL